MNKHAHKVIFSQHLGQLVVVGENASRSGKSAGGERGAPAEVAQTSAGGFYLGALRSIFAAGLLCVGGLGMVGHAQALDANALPTGALVQAGSVSHSVNDAGNVMNIVQTTNRAVVNYNSFNIGSAATVNHTGGVMLARVTGAGASQIQGTLNTSGMVLVNPNGIAIGSSANINAGSFTASTLNVTDDNFMAGNTVFERNGATGSVINAGTIKQLDNLGTEGGGYVALVGASVTNSGTITTQGGDVVLAAADTVTINAAQTSPSTVGVPLSQRVRLELAPEALQSATVDNSGVIVTEGGHVLMRAAAIVDAVSQVAQARVTHSGSIDTTGEQGGRVDILADKGIVRVSGSITANSTDGSAGGDIYIGRDEHTNVLAAVGDASGARLESQGGFVETSGRFLDIKGTRVLAKDWLLDPFNVIIQNAPGGGYTPNLHQGPEYNLSPTADDSVFFVEDIVANLNAGVRVTIQTTNTQPDGNQGIQAGNITVVDSIIKSGGNEASLTLKAHNDIIINAGVEIKSTHGKLNVVLNSDSDANDSGAIIMRSGSKILTKGGSIVMRGGTNAEGYAQGSGTQKYGVQLDNVTLDTTTTTTTTSSATEAGDITIRGRTTVDDGAGVYTTNAMVIKGKDISITGVADFTDDLSTGQGIWFHRNSVVNGGTGGTSITSDDGGNIRLTGEIKGGVGNAVRVQGGNVGSAFLVNSAGRTSIKGTQSGNENNTSDTVLLSGTQIISNQTLSIEAKAANSNSRAIALVREAGGLNNSGWEETYRSTNGNLEIKANQGAIVMNSATAPVLNGTNIIIDNTGSTFNADGSIATQGSGTSSLAKVKQFWHGGADMDAAGININHSGLNFHSPNSLSNSTAGLQVAAGGFITLVGSSSTGAGLNVRSNVNGSGNITLVGSSTAAGQAGVNLMGTINNTSSAGSTAVISNYGDVVFGESAKIIHNNSNTVGNVVVAAGVSQASGAGQIKVDGSAANRIQTPGKLFLFSGTLASTGRLGLLNAQFEKLHYQGTAYLHNAEFGKSYSADFSPQNTSKVFFREAVGPSNQFVLNLKNQTKNVGEDDPVIRLQDGSTLPEEIGTLVGSNTIVIKTSDLAIGRQPGEAPGNFAYTAANGFNITLGEARLTIVGPEPVPEPTPEPEPAPTPDPRPPVVPDDSPTGGGGSVSPFGDNNPFQLASADLAALLESEVCSEKNVESCDCESAKDENGFEIPGIKICSP